MNTDIAVIGGGASGLAAAISAKETAPESRVLICERMDRVGKKLLATGNGRCNLGNRNISSAMYHGSVDVMKIIGATCSAAEYFGRLGVICVSDSEGRMYPNSNSAATVLNALRLRCSELGIEEVCSSEITEIKGTSGKFELISENGRITAKRIIICTGGYAGPQYGTDGKMLGLLRKRGYRVAKITPADAPLRVAPDSVKGLKGVRVKGVVTAVSDGRKLASEKGEIQFTENSVSGICVFNLSHLFSKYEGKLSLFADLLPDMTEEEIIHYLKGIRKLRSSLQTEELLTGMFTKNLAIYLVKRILNRPLTDLISKISDNEIRSLAKAVKCLEFKVTGCSSWQNSQVTSGGIHADSIDEKLCSATEKGVYFAGEVLDADGICGGYNLQWAWSSGITAGRNCALSLNGG